MSLKLSHYVFSSLGGYRTVYVSPDMPRDLLAPLEVLARAVYLAAQRTDLYMWLRPGDGDDICAVKGFRNGTDHAGRSRSCVHAIVFSTSDAAGKWFFSPFCLSDDLFASPDSSLQSLANELIVEYDVGTPQMKPPPVDIPRDTMACLLAVMLNPSTSALILDERGDALVAVRSLVWLLPAPVRRSLTAAAWTAAPAIEGLGAPRLTVLTARSSEAKRPPAADVVLEYPSGKASAQGDEDYDDDKTFHVYAEFIASNITNERGIERLKKLAGLQERHPPTLELTQERYRHMLEGFATLEPNVEEWGSVTVLKDVKASLSSVKDFALAGMPSLSLDILNAVVSSAVDRLDMDAASMKGALERLRTGLSPEDPRFPEACGFLADQLAEVADAFGPNHGSG